MPQSKLPYLAPYLFAGPAIFLIPTALIVDA